jgi:hypothetical protein
MAMLFDNIRIGKKYWMRNFGETFEFTVEKRRGEKDYQIKDLHTLEAGFLVDLLKYGKGKDFDFREIDP